MKEYLILNYDDEVIEYYKGREDDAIKLFKDKVIEYRNKLYTTDKKPCRLVEIEVVVSSDVVLYS